MWTCVGCPRNFHAACVGVAVQRSSLRRKDKRVTDTSSYVLPCCAPCQNLVTGSFEFNALVQQQEQLADQINKNTEVIHRAAVNNTSDGIIHEAIDRLEAHLGEIKKLLTSKKINDSIGNSVINQSLDMSMAQVTITNSVESMRTDISKEMKILNEEMRRISSLTLDLSSTVTMCSNPWLGTDILDELKTLSTNIMGCHNESPLQSLETELAAEPKNTNGLQSLESNNQPDLNLPRPIPEKTRDELNFHAKYKEPRDYDPLWRWKGRWIWKRDWSEFDACIRRQKQKKTDRSRDKQKHKRNYCNNKTDQHHHTTHRGAVTNKNSHTPILPRDRELLAAAKEHFSRPPPPSSQHPYRPTIAFRRGEVLNPYFAANHSRTTNAISPSPRPCVCQCFCQN